MGASCGVFGGDEPDDAGAGPPEPAVAEVDEPAAEEPEPESVVEVPLEVPEPSDEQPVLDVPEAEPAAPPEAPEPVEEPAVVEEGCRWETERGADVFGDYLMANVVCTVRYPESADRDELAGLLALPSVVVDPERIVDPADGIEPDLAAIAEELGPIAPEPEFFETRFGWRCSVGELEGVSGDGYYRFEHTGRLEVFASNGGPPHTLSIRAGHGIGPDGAPDLDQELGLGPEGSPAGTGPSAGADRPREAAVLVRFGSDHYPFAPEWRVVVTGADLVSDDDELEPSAENQRIAYGLLWRNSENRPPRDRAGVLSVLEDRNYGGRYDPDEFETSQEHSTHDEHLLYAPDEMVGPITAALLRDESGRLHTAIAGVYVDFDISGWEAHVGPVLEACWFRGVPTGSPDPDEPESTDEPDGLQDEGEADAGGPDEGGPDEADAGGEQAESETDESG